MQLALEASLGSVSRWRDEFAACARAPGGGAGRVLLAFMAHEGRLVHQRSGGDAVAGAVPLLALDLCDLPGASSGGLSGGLGDGLRDGLRNGLSDGDGVDATIDGIDWPAVHARYRSAVVAATEACGVDIDGVGDALLLDVRRAGAYAQARTVIPGARWCDPAAVAAWGAELPPGRAVVACCVHGHEVSRAVALRLRAAGLDARYLRGGIEGWQAAGRPMVDKPAGPAP